MAKASLSPQSYMDSSGKLVNASRLMQWRVGGTNPDETYRLLIGHPRFGEAVRVLAQNMRTVAAGDPALDGVFKDAGRYIAAMLVIHLHVSGGLTLPRLKQLCATSGFLSEGRARAMLQYLRYLGFVELVTPGGTRGIPARYAPTPTLMVAWLRHLAAALDAARIIDPAVGLVLEQLDRPDVADLLVKVNCETLLASAHLAYQEALFLNVFMHRYAGTQIVWILILADEEVFPPRKPVPLSMAANAKQFRVSRIHIKRLLSDAERAGLLRYETGGDIILEESARTAIRYIYAHQLICLLSSAARTLTERSFPAPRYTPRTTRRAKENAAPQSHPATTGIGDLQLPDIAVISESTHGSG